MASYPAINAHGIITQFPYGEIDEYHIVESSTPAGFSVARAVTGNLQRRFSLSYSCIQRAEVTIIENFFLSMRGKLGFFSFTDDGGTIWANTRFDDDLEIEYVDWNHYSMKVLLAAF